LKPGGECDSSAALTTRQIFIQFPHEVVDKYERVPGVINEDLVAYAPVAGSILGGGDVQKII
jgi:hypothetical protein